MHDVAVKVENVSKCFHIYEKPIDRLKQFFVPRVESVLGKDQTKYFTEFWALEDVSFQINKGETVGIVGTNGSGKSTLLQIICGTLNPSRGQVRTNGRIAALLELGSGFNPEFTGRENVYMNAAVLGLTVDEINKKFDSVLAFAEIGQFIDQPVKTYSSGMMMRLAFSVAIHVEPEILIVDEALAVGDERFQRKCFSRIEQIRNDGATILFVSHSGGTVIELCDRAILLDAGEKLAIGTPKQIVGSYQKLLYAPSDARNKIREQILNHEIQANIVNEMQSFDDQQQVKDQQHVKLLKESYDPNLKPTSQVEYQSLGAVIEDPKILTIGGEQVNHLVRGKAYRYCYKVRFSQDCSGIKFGMLLKTTSGVELGGAISTYDQGVQSLVAKQGSVYNVEFKFNCNLNPNVYFLNAGVMGLVDGHETYLHRQIDFAMFRVLSDNDQYKHGIVDFGFFPEYQLEE